MFTTRPLLFICNAFFFTFGLLNTSFVGAESPVLSKECLSHVPAKYRSDHEELARYLSERIYYSQLSSMMCDPRIYEKPKLHQTYLSWSHLRARVLSQKSIEDGVDFLKKNDTIFDRVEKIYGVDRYAITAILRIETYFGKNLGINPVVNSLYYMYMENPRRRNFAKRELLAFLFFIRENGWDPFAIPGSWAGAYGLPQFIPSSSHAYGKDGNGDGEVDLFNLEDAIFSIANYLNRHGWRADQHQAVFRYNRSRQYTNIVLEYRKILIKRSMHK